MGKQKLNLYLTELFELELFDKTEQLEIEMLLTIKLCTELSEIELFICIKWIWH